MGAIKRCETCRFRDYPETAAPCYSCSIPDYNNWTPVVEHNEEPPEKYTYFVVYSFLNENNQNGVGSCYVEREDRIRTKNDVEDVAADIGIKFDFLKITILNWKELEG